MDFTSEGYARQVSKPESGLGEANLLVKNVKTHIEFRVEDCRTSDSMFVLLSPDGAEELCGYLRRLIEEIRKGNGRSDAVAEGK